MLALASSWWSGPGSVWVRPPMLTRAAQEPAQTEFKSSADETARQVTVFAILATNDPAAIDPRLASVNAQLRKVLPDHGFKLLDVKSKRIEAAQSVTCDLGQWLQGRDRPGSAAR